MDGTFAESKSGADYMMLIPPRL